MSEDSVVIIDHEYDSPKHAKPIVVSKSVANPWRNKKHAVLAEAGCKKSWPITPKFIRALSKLNWA
jgi:hypothetical protein